MIGFTRVCLIGFGEVGQILAADLAKAGVGEIAAYDIPFDRPDSAPSRAAFGPRRASSAISAAENAELIISAVTAAADLDAAKSVACGITPLMSRSIAARQDWAASHRSALAEGGLHPMLDALLKTIDAGAEPASPHEECV
ncbi:MAG TPA: NAD(P)-binding domain-containing protein [Bradyrhizobium sp.]|nr:NAD(P)-binding domain-containing protein [Bradyrhizobium sp.]